MLVPCGLMSQHQEVEVEDQVHGLTKVGINQPTKNFSSNFLQM